jgi:hypothetical protein
VSVVGARPNFMKAFEPVLREHAPEWVVVVGDVNSTIACGLVAVKLGLKLAHVEAGLRSFDRTMPEAINRILTDAISDLCLCEVQAQGSADYPVPPMWDGRAPERIAQVSLAASKAGNGRELRGEGRK